MSKNHTKCLSLAHIQTAISLSLIITILLVCQQFKTTEASKSNNNNTNKKEVSRRSIVFDIKTPKVFYCPQEKQSDRSKMIVKAKPLDKLCEFEGKMKPKNSPSDCYNDVDETEFACDEKKRFLVRLDADQEVTTTNPLEDLADSDPEYILSKGSSKKKASPSGKKY